jgi:hypothetical protein
MQVLFTLTEPIRRGWYGGSGISYSFLFIGELQVWWVPYLFRDQPIRAVRYRSRNGIRPNTLHVILHLATLATLFVLAALTVP